MKLFVNFAIIPKRLKETSEAKRMRKNPQKERKIQNKSGEVEKESTSNKWISL